jgi:hypothetical protein
VFSLGIVEREGPGDFFREEEWDRVRARLPGSEVFPLDRRYGIAVSRSGGATELRPVNRRGTLYPGFVLPFALHDLTRHPDLSDRLLGIERSPRPRGAIVCLKPFRVTRTPFPGFLPDSVRCVEGGYRLERGDRAVEIRWER